MPVLLLLLLLVLGCAAEPEKQEAPPLSIVLITLDTTRADAVGPEAAAGTTPHLTALAERGLRFTHAYTTAPMTLPAHASMMTGLLPADHGVHENARRLGDGHALAAEHLQRAGYNTAAFVSGYPLAQQFGLARGFEHYDDDLSEAVGGAEAAERRADGTTDRALAYLQSRGAPEKPFFVWAHYFDPHEPYEPPAPFDSADDPYLGEISFMDQEIGRLLAALDSRTRVIVVGDHGESRGEHGEQLHGNLLYQAVMRVPLLIAGEGVPIGVREDPVSVRRIYDTLVGWGNNATGAEGRGLLNIIGESVLAEAMKPYLQYGWQPQVMGVRDTGESTLKLIRAGEASLEIYNLDNDPEESRELEEGAADRALARAVGEYPWPSAQAESADLSNEDREKLASLGYVNWDVQATLREDAPRPRDMTHIFADLDLGSGLFVRGELEEAVRVFERVARQDPNNPVVCLRLAVALSVLGDAEGAMFWFRRAEAIDPDSVDLRHYLGMHHFAAGDREAAAPLLESVLVLMPKRLPALEALARIRADQARWDEAADLLERAATLKSEPGDLLVELGGVSMAAGNTPAAISAFERAQAAQGESFRHHLELGVCYLADRQVEAARDLLDQVAESHPQYPLALFKRAQVSVLLGEADRGERIRLARERADDVTRRLIENEPLFRRP